MLTELLCPWGEHRPWFAGDVADELALRGLEVRAETLVGHLDVRDVLADPGGRGEPVFDFLVGARTAEIPVQARDQVLGYLRDIAPAGIHVPQPLDIMIARVP